MKTFNEDISFKDIKFIRDDSEKERTALINEILEVINKDSEKERRLNIGSRFFYALFLAAKDIKNKNVKEESKNTINIKPILDKVKKSNIQNKDVQNLKIKESSVAEELKIPLPEDIKEDVEENNLKLMEKDYVVLRSKDNRDLVNVSISYDDKLERLDYILNEPKIKEEITDNVKKETKGLFKDANKLLKDDNFLSKTINKLCKKFKIEYRDEYLDYVKYYLYRDLVNFGKIDGLIRDMNVKSIICDGLYKVVKVKYNYMELNTNIVFDNEEDLNYIIRKFAERLNIKINTKKINEVNGIVNNFNVQSTLGFKDVNSKFVLTRI